MRRIVTHHGFCYTYNLLEHDTIFRPDVMSSDFDFYKGTVFARDIFKNTSNEVQWTLGTGYTENGTVPFRITNRHHFKIDMKFTFDAIYSCKTMNRNYKVIIHLPSEIPTPFHYYKFIESNNANRITMSAQYYDTSENLRKFAPDMRDCFFEGERQLKFFKTYTKSQCNLECLTNYTLKTCGCVKFSMPREQNTPVCNLTQVVCYEEAKSDWLDLRVENKCMCLQPCTYIIYAFESEDRMYDG
jgi:amiloride-sensitive sodium channel